MVRIKHSAGVPPVGAVRSLVQLVVGLSKGLLPAGRRQHASEELLRECFDFNEFKAHGRCLFSQFS